MKDTPPSLQCLSRCSGFLAVALSLAGVRHASAQTINIGGLDHVYNGAAKSATVTTVPANLAKIVYYRDASLPPANTPSEIIFKNRPDTIDLSYPSQNLAGTNFDYLGNVITLGGEPRELETCEVTLVNWARASQFPALAAANPAGYEHPITLSIFRVTSAAVFAKIGEVTKTVLVPWRPDTLPNGQQYPYNGYAFRVNFDVPQGTLLPERIMVAVGFKTSKSGSAPMPTAGPYDALNVGLFHPAATIGADDNPDRVFHSKNGVLSFSSGWATASGPMIRMTATWPDGETTTAPINAGSYTVRAVLTGADSYSHKRAVLTIQKAPVTVNLSNLTQPRTGAPRVVGTATVPTGYTVGVTYNGSASPPSAAGLYQVLASVEAPNHQGTATGVLRIGDLFSTWITGKAPAGQIGETQDPDGDNLSNLLEYGLSLAPGTADHTGAAYRIEPEGANLAIFYQENLDAAELSYVLEQSATLATADSWTPATPLSRTVLGETGSVRSVKLLVAPTSANTYFRVRVQQAE